MAEILVLCTYWEPNYWERDRVAPYPKRSIEPVKHMKNKTPIPAIGVYTKGKGKDYTHQPPCFLIIKNISENEKGEPQFDFHFISQMQGLTSVQFLAEIQKRDLFYSVSEEEALPVLEKLGVKPPPEWQKLLEAKPLLVPSWPDWIGRYPQRF